MFHTLYIRIVSDIMEMLTIELLYHNQRFLLTTVYHPPTSYPVKNNEFVDLFTLYLRRLIDLKIPLIVAGDFNINLLNPRNCMYVDTYIKNLFELGLKPLVTLPTKVNMENIITQFSIIDHIWVSEGLRSDLSCIIPVNISDHFPVISLITTDFQETSPVSLKRRRFIARGKEAFRIFLSNVSINNGGNSMNFIYDEYFRKVFDGYNRAFPIQNYVRKTKQASPWMTARLKECIRKKSKLYRGYLKGRVSKEEYTWFKKQSK